MSKESGSSGEAALVQADTSSKKIRHFETEDGDLYSFEIRIIGDCGVGKSSVIYTFDGEDGNIKQLPFGDYRNYNETTKILEIDDKRVKLWIRDKPYGYSKDANIFMYDITNKDSFINTTQAVENMQREFASKRIPRTLVLGNKPDSAEEHRAVDTHIVEQFSRKKGARYLECSVRDHTTVKDIVYEITKEVLNEDLKRRECDSGDFDSFETQTIPRAEYDDLYSFEIRLIGDCGVGKSSVIYTFDGEDGNIKQLPFGDYRNYNETTKILEIDEKRVKLWVRDKPYGYSKDANIFMYDITNKDSFINTTQAVENMQREFASKRMPRTLILGNKPDSAEEHRAVDTHIVEQFARKKGARYLECSVRDHTTVKDIVYEITKEVLNEDLNRECGSGGK